VAKFVIRIAGTLASVPLLLLAVACGSGSQQAAAPPDQGAGQQPRTKLKVVTTVLPINLFTQAVAGDCATVIPLLPAGADTHAFQARPQDVATLGKAQVMVINGLGLEAFIEPLLKSADNPDLITIDSSQGITPLKLEDNPSADHGHDHDHDHGHSHSHGHSEAEGAVDPHIWLDPQLAAQQVKTIRDGLIQADPGCADGYRERAQSYLSQLKQLDDGLANQLAPFRGRTVVSYHEALGYFVRRYDLKAEAVVTLPSDQPTPADVQRVSAALKQANVNGVLTEPGGGSSALQALANDLDLSLSVFDPMELVPADQQRIPSLYINVMQSNGAAVTSTLQP
jgi:zinc transport system substrate-binding protein